jgi:hypothetical protein
MQSVVLGGESKAQQFCPCCLSATENLLSDPLCPCGHCSKIFSLREFRSAPSADHRSVAERCLAVSAVLS